MQRLDLGALRRVAREADAYPLLSTREGAQSCRLPQGQLLHSAYDPWSEARRQVREAGVGPSSRPLLLGAGLGYQAVACLEAGAKALRIVECDARCLSTLAAMPWAGELLRDPRVELLHFKDDAGFTSLLTRLFEGEHGSQPLLTLSPVPRLWEGRAPRAANMVRDILSRRLNGYAQEASLDWNREQNRRFLETSAELNLYSGAWRNRPVVVAGAGPGLDRDLPELLRTREEFRLVAVNASLAPLLGAGIVPDLCVAVDGMNVIQADLPVRAVDLPLLWIPGTNHGFVSGWPGPRILALPVGPGLPPAAWEGAMPGFLQSGMGTVIGPALDAASQLSGGPLLLSGVDLGSAGERLYAGRVRRQAVASVRSDFAYMRRQLGTFVQELRMKGRRVGAFGDCPDWLAELHSPRPLSCSMEESA